MKPRYRSYDAAPLLAHLRVASLERGRSDYLGAELGRADVLSMARVAGVAPETVHRWRRGGRVGWRVADRCAIALELHPLLLWPDFDR